MRLLDIAERRPWFRQKQSRAAAGAPLANTTGLEHDRLHAGKRARIRGRAAGQAAADNHDVCRLCATKA